MIGQDDYWWRGQRWGYDRWGYAKSQCASFCEQRWVHDLGQPVGLWGDAWMWPGRAARSGYRVDGSAEPHSILCLAPGAQGAFGAGHVAFVVGVRGGAVDVEQYNYGQGFEFRYSRWTFSAVGGTRFIHPRSAPPPPSPVPAPGLPPDAYPQVHCRFSGQVMNDKGANVRRDPHLNAPVYYVAPHGQEFYFDGFSYGDAAWDPVMKRNDRRWFHVAPDTPGGRRNDPEWLASAMVNGYPPSPPGSHP